MNQLALDFTKSSRNRAYNSLRPELGRMQQEVLDVLKKYPTGLTNSEISRLMGKPINCITGRVNELMDKDKVIPDGSRLNQYTGKPNTIFKAI